MPAQKKQNLLGAAGVLVFSTIIVKLIGALYKIPLANLISTTGYGYFTAAYEIYTPIYTISMAGLPIAVSRLVSENIAANRIRQARQVFRVSQKIFLCVGLFGTLLLFAVAYPYSRYIIDTPENFASILAIAPCVFFCCIMSSYRGFYEGTRNMFPTAISQILEAVGKVIFGLALSFLTMRYGLSIFDGAASTPVSIFGTSVSTRAEALSAIYPYAAAMAILGVTLGSLLGMIYLIISNKLKGGVFTDQQLEQSDAPDPVKATALKIVKIAIPIALSSMVLTVSNFIDSVTIKDRLAFAMEHGGDIIRNMYASSITMDKVLDKDIPTYLYGAYALALNLKNLIPTLTMSLGVSVIPILSAAWSQKNKLDVKKSVEQVFRLTMLIGMPASFGMAALATPIIDLLYGRKNPGTVPIAGPILAVYAVFIFLYAMSSPLTNMLNAVNKMSTPLIAVAIGSVFKIGLNYLFVGNPNINVNGAPISTLVCYLIVVVYNLVVLVKTTKVKINFLSVFFKPLIAGLICGGAAYGSYWLLTSQNIAGGKLSCLASVCVGGVFYFASLLLIKGFAREDIEMLPKGKNIAKVLEKFRLIG